MQNRLFMRLKSLFSIALFFALFLVVNAQNVNLQVHITGVERTNYGDCTACGNPDPTWKITAVDNAPGSPTAGPVCFHYAEDPNTIEIQNYLIWNVTNSVATQFTLGMNDAFEKNCSSGRDCQFESYNFFNCFPSAYGDNHECSNPNLAVVNFLDSAPCIVHNTISVWCGEYRFYYSFSWSYNYPPTLITQPQSASLCLGQPTTLSVAAALDAHGWNTGKNYQWQVSTSTACPGTGWVNVNNATSSTFTAPQTGGTRLYRCLVTSNCAADFSTHTTVSNCAVVTYSPIGAPGDPIPPIVSGICGSTVLPGSYSWRCHRRYWI